MKGHTVILDDMKAALEPMFNLADPDEIEMPSLLVNGDHSRGALSMYLSNSMVLDADYRNLRFDKDTNMWWVDLSNLYMHDDPSYFEM